MDLDKLSKQEILELINTKKTNISKLKSEEDYYDALQLGLKLVLNGTYGAFLNGHFKCFDPNIGAAITAMGRNVAKYMDLINQDYFYNEWHLDTELHNILNINTPKQIEKPDHKFYEEEIDEKSKAFLRKSGNANFISVYSDTDSGFVSFLPVLNSCNYSKSGINFCIDIYENRLKNLHKEKLNIYCNELNVKNLYNFALERINYSILFLDKKKYIQHVAWEEDKNFDMLKYLYPKGVEIVKSNTPPFVRKKMFDIINYIFLNGKTVSQREILKILKQIKNEFKEKANLGLNIEEISMKSKISKYNEWIIDDVISVKIKKGVQSKNKNGDNYTKSAHFTVKSAAYTNWEINKKPYLKNKYNLLKNDDKVKFYFAENWHTEYFVYLHGQFPIEIAPKIDIDKQFEKTFLSVLNMIIKPLGFNPFDAKLIYQQSLF